MKVKYICVSLCLLVTFFGAGNVTAQNFLLSLNFLTGDPKGEFDDNVENLGFGFSGMFGYHPNASPVMIGGELAFMRYGSETRNEPFSTTIPDVRVDVETSGTTFSYCTRSCVCKATRAPSVRISMAW